jgi:predicted porin
MGRSPRRLYGSSGSLCKALHSDPELSFGYTYNLSKRTSLYGIAAQIKNKGAANFLTGGPGSALGGTSRGVQLGLRHAF